MAHAFMGLVSQNHFPQMRSLYILPGKHGERQLRGKRDGCMPADPVKERLRFLPESKDTRAGYRGGILPDTEHSVNYMTLLIDSDRDKATGWEGYDYKITSGKVYAWKDGSWQEIGQAAWEVRGDKLMLQADRALIGLCGEGKPEFEFKWIDNIALNDVMNFYKDGDCAPFGRFNYVF